MFPNTKGGYMRGTSLYSVILDPAYDAAGWRGGAVACAWTFHTLRHVFCTTALNDWDLDVTDVSVLAGHANTQITMERYVSNTAGTLSRAFLLTASASSGPEPSQPAGPDGAAVAQPGSRTVLAPGRPIEIERTVGDDGRVAVADGHADIGKRWAGRTVTLRLDGNRMHGILDSALIGIWPCPVPAVALAGLDGAVPARPRRRHRRTHPALEQRTHRGHCEPTKVIKRSMYGRANFDPLRRLVLLRS
jgi:hypothetical protein